MATWAKVEKFIKQKYVVAEQDGKWLFLDFELDDGRTQRVMVTTTGDLIQFLSPFASLAEVDITQVLSAMRAAAIAERLPARTCRICRRPSCTVNSTSQRSR